MIEELTLISQKLAGTVLEMDTLRYVWPPGLRSYLLEINQELDELILNTIKAQHTESSKTQWPNSPNSSSLKN